MKERERERKRRRDEKLTFICSGTMEVLGSLYAIYKPEYYYWECVVISRRLLIAIIITLVPFNSLVSLVMSENIERVRGCRRQERMRDISLTLFQWLYFGFFIVIQGYASAHNIYNPYAHKMDSIIHKCLKLILSTSVPFSSLYF